MKINVLCLFSVMISVSASAQMSTPESRANERFDGMKLLPEPMNQVDGKKHCVEIGEGWVLPPTEMANYIAADWNDIPALKALPHKTEGIATDEIVTDKIAKEHNATLGKVVGGAIVVGKKANAGDAVAIDFKIRNSFPASPSTKLDIVCVKLKKVFAKPEGMNLKSVYAVKYVKALEELTPDRCEQFCLHIATPSRGGCAGLPQFITCLNKAVWASSEEVKNKQPTEACQILLENDLNSPSTLRVGNPEEWAKEISRANRYYLKLRPNTPDFRGRALYEKNNLNWCQYTDSELRSVVGDKPMESPQSNGGGYGG